MTPGIETLQALPVSPIELIHTPLLGNTRQETKDLRQGRHPDVVREWARVTGWFSEYVYSRDNRREITRDVLADTGCKLSLQLDPWKIGQGDFINPQDEAAIVERVAQIAGQVCDWSGLLGYVPDLVKVSDESVKLDRANADWILARTYDLWHGLRDCEANTVHWYNARMVRDDGLYPYVHSLAPGPSACSLYHWGNQVNARRFGNTINLADRLGLQTIAHVELHRQRERGGRYESIGHEPERFEELGGNIKWSGVKLVSLDEVPIIKDGHVNKNVVANLAALIEGMS